VGEGSLHAGAQSHAAMVLSNTAKWLVDGEQSDTPSGLYERGTLFLHSSHGADIHEGQYAMPFQILITALGPL